MSPPIPPTETIKYHAEYHSKINAVTLSVQVPPLGLGCRIGPEAIDLIPRPQTQHQHEQPSPSSTLSVKMPALIMPTRTTLDPSSGKSSMLTLKLTAMPSIQSLSLSSTMAGEFPAAPLPASKLQGLQNIGCGCCGNLLLNKTDKDDASKGDISKDATAVKGPIHRVVDLPSEHWQELVDCWMCHEEDFTELREGDLGARLGQALVGGTYLLIHAGNVDQDTVAIEQDARAIDWSRGVKRRWRPLSCSRCLSPVGDGWYQSRKEDGTDLEMIQVKFHKYMVDYHGYNETSQQQLTVPRQRFAAYVAAEIFESARHHATYRFIVQDRLSGRDMMLLWMLNWDSTIITNLEPVQDEHIYWDSSLGADLPVLQHMSQEQGTSTTRVSNVSVGQKVMKVLYLKAIPEEDRDISGDKRSDPSKEEVLWDRWRGDPGVERLEFQERLVLGLLTMLDQSSSCLPPDLNGAASAVLAMEGMHVGSFEI